MGLPSAPQAGGSPAGGAEAEGVQVAGHAQQLGQVDGQEAQKGEGPDLGPGLGIGHWEEEEEGGSTSAWRSRAFSSCQLP